MPMDDLTKYLNFIYEAVEGYVYVASKPAGKDVGWHQEFFSWPEEQPKIHAYITAQSHDNDVYIAPALFAQKSGLKSAFKGTNVVWIEFDGQEQIDFGSSGIPEPSLMVRTSGDSHFHCYWKIPYCTNVQTVENINRRLMYHMEADSTGWDATQVLRPPTSLNWKYGEAQQVILTRHDNSTIFDFSSFDAAPEVKQEVIKLTEDSLLSPEKLLNDLPLHAKLKRRIISETVPGPKEGKPGSRSQFLMKIAYELAEEGCSHLQIVSLLDYVDKRIGKFTGRRDRLTRISEIASLACLSVQSEETIFLYSPLDIINHKETLEWLWPNLIHRQGFCIITGAPGVGKTQFGLQVIRHLATANTLLQRDVQGPNKCLFISLEMSIIELQYIFERHGKEWAKDKLWNDNIRMLDRESSLLEYEEVIADFEPSVVLIDSLTELASDDLKETESRAITRWIKKIRRRYNCAVICIHHNRKESAGGKNKATSLSDVYGSFIFGKDSDTVLNLWQDPETKEIEFTSFKQRYDKKLELVLTRSDNLVFNVKETETDDSNAGESTPGKVNFKFS